MTSPNRAYLALCLRHFAQIQQSWTSDTLGTLYDIPPRSLEMSKKKNLEQE